jgi:hypothetical protein
VQSVDWPRCDCFTFVYTTPHPAPYNLQALWPFIKVILPLARLVIGSIGTW